ncbi:MAG TPA: EscU/YscU/HrcU family type III secretion system export apparatus switch protein [Polyangiaceae bacterium]
MSEKTENATPKRLAKARREGDAGASPFAARSVALLAVLTVLPAGVTATIAWFADAMKAAITQAATRPDLSSFDPTAPARAVVTLAAPLLLIAAVASTAATWAQTGAVFAPKAITPDATRLDPFAGFGRRFSIATFVATTRALVYGAAATFVVVLALRDHAADLAHLAGRASAVGPFVLAVALSTWKTIALTGLALAAVDLAITRMLWRNRLKMSHEEIVRERRESEGDPHVREARKRAFDELLAGSTRLEDAAIVVADHDSFACALRWKRGSDVAPTVIVSGSSVARAAELANVPIVVDADLARTLASVRVGRTIPERLWDDVAAHLTKLGVA